MFCRHEWKVISETTTSSKFQHTCDALKSAGAGVRTVPWQMSDASRKHIQIVACGKCGKLKRFVEKI